MQIDFSDDNEAEPRARRPRFALNSVEAVEAFDQKQESPKRTNTGGVNMLDEVYAAQKIQFNLKEILPKTSVIHWLCAMSTQGPKVTKTC